MQTIKRFLLIVLLLILCLSYQAQKEKLQIAALEFLSIKVNPEETIRLHSVGFKSVDRNATTCNTFSVSLKQSENISYEVAETAKSIKTSPEELGYSVQAVRGSDAVQTINPFICSFSSFL